ncbi:pyrroline-5-carboxylate reductase [Profundibacter sp.]|uniref:pyrroline-5-carboxylate reductase n=1 Tax=Profundibacter sp. TaxID=3101071 RepID=UPI003D118441
MDMNDVKNRGLVMLGCGKMGSAMLQGWLGQGLPAASTWVLDPHPNGWVQGLAGEGLHLNTDLPDDPAIVLIAVKPQMMEEALPVLTPLGNGKTQFMSVAAGKSLAFYEQALGDKTPVIRAMPNTPAAISRGITALVGNGNTGDAELALAESLLQAVGQTVRLENEAQIDAVTGVSGSGPAYVFLMIEALAAAGVEQGLPADMAMQLAKATVSGAGQLAETAEEDPAQLRVNVTSPQGTTAAALEVLMDPETGLTPLMKRAVSASTDRSKELSK